MSEIKNVKLYLQWQRTILNVTIWHHWL